MNPARRYFPLAEAARHLRVSRLRVIEMIHDGQLRAKLSGGKWWVEVISLDALLQSRGRKVRVA